MNGLHPRMGEAGAFGGVVFVIAPASECRVIPPGENAETLPSVRNHVQAFRVSVALPFASSDSKQYSGQILTDEKGSRQDVSADTSFCFNLPFFPKPAEYSICSC